MKEPLFSPNESTGYDLDQISDAIRHKRVLIIEDDPSTLSILKRLMIDAGLNVAGAANGEEGLQKCVATQPDIILLDLVMPVMDGWETLAALRKITSAPIVIVSGVEAKEMVVKGLKLGAYDYVQKPYYPDELVARVIRILESNQKTQDSKGFYFPKIDLHIDLQSREVIYQNKAIQLTPRVFAVLVALAKHAPHVVGNSEIAHEVWGEDTARHENRIKNLVFVLRQHLEDNPDEPRIVISRGGIGYRLGTEGYKPEE